MNAKVRDKCRGVHHSSHMQRTIICMPQQCDPGILVRNLGATTVLQCAARSGRCSIRVGYACRPRARPGLPACQQSTYGMQPPLVRQPTLTWTAQPELHSRQKQMRCPTVNHPPSSASIRSARHVHIINRERRTIGGEQTSRLMKVLACMSAFVRSAAWPRHGRATQNCDCNSGWSGCRGICGRSPGCYRPGSSTCQTAMYERRLLTSQKRPSGWLATGHTQTSISRASVSDGCTTSPSVMTLSAPLWPSTTCDT